MEREKDGLMRKESWQGGEIRTEVWRHKDRDTVGQTGNKGDRGKKTKKGKETEKKQERQQK